MPRILIVEDNDRIAEVICQFLQNKGFEADVALNGPAALRSFSERPYDLLLLDLRLPQLDGEDVCRQVRTMERGGSVPIIMMSGYAKDPPEIRRLQQVHGLAGYLIKPFASEALLSLIRSSLAAQAPAASAETAQAQRQPASISGTLDRTAFDLVLFTLMRKSMTGTLALFRDGAARTFLFVGGAPVDVETPPGDDDFGAHLSRRNLVTAEELRTYRERREGSDGERRDLFVMMGCLTPSQFAEEVRNYVMERLVECFAWENGTLRFEAQVPFPPVAPAAAVLLPAVFYRGFKTHLPPAVLGSFLEKNGARYAVRTPGFYEFRGHLAVELSDPELLERIDGKRTCSEIVSGSDTDEAPVVLYTLDRLRVLSYADAPAEAAAPPFPVRQAAARAVPAEAPQETFEDLGGELSQLAESIDGLAEATAASSAPPGGDQRSALERDLQEQWEAVKDKNYYEVFGLTQKTFSFEKLKKAYFDLTRTYGPEKFFASSGQTMELAEELLSRVSNAYNTLSNVVSKENYDELLASQVPTGDAEKRFFEQVQFQSGKVLLEQGQYENAERAFSTILTITPDRPEYMVYLALAVHHNPANRGNTAAMKRAKDLVNKSLQFEKTSIAYALKGTMLLDEGLANLAEAEFHKALKLNPNNKTAQKSLESIQQRRENEKKGFFQRMFT